jgi:hypothetical protein
MTALMQVVRPLPRDPVRRPVACPSRPGRVRCPVTTSRVRTVIAIVTGRSITSAEADRGTGGATVVIASGTSGTGAGETGDRKGRRTGATVIGGIEIVTAIESGIGGETGEAGQGIGGGTTMEMGRKGRVPEDAIEASGRRTVGMIGITGVDV